MTFSTPRSSSSTRTRRPRRCVRLMLRNGAVIQRSRQAPPAHRRRLQPDVASRSAKKVRQNGRDWRSEHPEGSTSVDRHRCRGGGRRTSWLRGGDLGRARDRCDDRGHLGSEPLRHVADLFNCATIDAARRPHVSLGQPQVDRGHQSSRLPKRSAGGDHRHRAERRAIWLQHRHGVLPPTGGYHRQQRDTGLEPSGHTSRVHVRQAASARGGRWN